MCVAKYPTTAIFVGGTLCSYLYLCSLQSIASDPSQATTEMEFTLINPGHLSPVIRLFYLAPTMVSAIPEYHSCPTGSLPVVTPLHPTVWERYLTKHPNCQLVEFFLQGLLEGFHIGFDYASPITLKSAKTNMESARLHAEVVDDYLQTEISLGHVASPFLPEDIRGGHVSRFGVIPKNHQPNKWRLIVDLSHPTNNSVNDGTSSPLCTLHYVTVDDAVCQIDSLGRRCLLAKIDIQIAFRLLPVHPVDIHLLLMK